MAGLFGLRSKNLVRGMESLLGECEARKLYAHPLIRSLSKEGKLPSYLRSSTVAAALVGIVHAGEDDAAPDSSRTRPSASDGPDNAAAAVEGDSPLRRVVRVLQREEEGDDALEGRLAVWLDEGMDRVSGWYKRRVQFIMLVIAGSVTVAVNADTIWMAKQLWSDDAFRARTVAEAMAFNGQDVSDPERTDSGTGSEAGAPQDPEVDADPSTDAAAEGPASVASSEVGDGGGVEDASSEDSLPSADEETGSGAQLGADAGSSEGDASGEALNDEAALLTKKEGRGADPCGRESDTSLDEGVSYLTHFPLGYPDSFRLQPLVILGWLLTVAAISLGAPFWFDLLSKVSRIRSSGRSQATREP